MQYEPKTPHIDFISNIFYQRIRLETIKIEYNYKEELMVSNLGLYILAVYPNLKFNNHTLAEEIDWLYILKKTIFITLIGKLLNGEVELYKYNDKEYFLFGLFKRKIENYYFQPKELKEGENSFEKAINDSFTYCHKRFKQKNNINKLVHHFLNKYINKQGQNKPAKTFWKINLQNLSIENNKFTLIDKEALLGVSTSYQSIIRTEVVDEIIENQYKINNVFIKNNFNKSFSPSDFKTNLNKIIQDDINKRLPKHNH